jgi:hypothetical protein
MRILIVKSYMTLEALEALYQCMLEKFFESNNM